MKNCGFFPGNQEKIHEYTYVYPPHAFKKEIEEQDEITRGDIADMLRDYYESLEEEARDTETVEIRERSVPDLRSDLIIWVFQAIVDCRRSDEDIVYKAPALTQLVELANQLLVSEKTFK